MEETPIQRLEKIVELMKKLPDDLEIIFDMAQNDPAIMQKLAQMAVEILNLPVRMQRELARIAVRQAVEIGDADRGTA
jgi:Ni,Fe-hydrogenase III large subunit